MDCSGAWALCRHVTAAVVTTALARVRAPGFGEVAETTAAAEASTTGACSHALSRVRCATEDIYDAALDPETKTAPPSPAAAREPTKQPPPQPETPSSLLSSFFY